MKRIAYSVGGAVLVGAVAIGIGGPFWAARQIEVSALNNDIDTLAGYIDEEAISIDLAQRYAAETLTKGRTDWADDAFMAMGTEATARSLRAFTSPYAISRLITHGSLKDLAADQKQSTLQHRQGYVSPNRFRIRTFSPELKADGPSFLLGRQNLFQWRIIRIEPAPSAS